jgi:hypothetical protein
MTLGELEDAVADIAVDTLDRVSMGELRSMEEAKAHFDRRIAGLGQSSDGSDSSDGSGAPSAPASSSSPGILTALTPLTTGVVSSLSSQAMTAIQPAIMQILNQYGPTFAGIMGASMGLFVLLGAYIAKESILRVHRKRTKKNPHYRRSARRRRYV